MLVIGLDQEQMEKEMFEVVVLVELILVDHLKLDKIHVYFSILMRKR
jgi:hypothetical protein